MAEEWPCQIFIPCLPNAAYLQYNAHSLLTNAYGKTTIMGWLISIVFENVVNCSLYDFSGVVTYPKSVVYESVALVKNQLFSLGAIIQFNNKRPTSASTPIAVSARAPKLRSSITCAPTATRYARSISSSVRSSLAVSLLLGPRPGTYNWQLGLEHY